MMFADAGDCPRTSIAPVGILSLQSCRYLSCEGLKFLTLIAAFPANKVERGRRHPWQR